MAIMCDDELREAVADALDEAAKNPDQPQEVSAQHEKAEREVVERGLVGNGKVPNDVTVALEFLTQWAMAATHGGWERPVRAPNKQFSITGQEHWRELARITAKELRTKPTLPPRVLWHFDRNPE